MGCSRGRRCGKVPETARCRSQVPPKYLCPGRRGHLGTQAPASGPRRGWTYDLQQRRQSRRTCTANPISPSVHWQPTSRHVPRPTLSVAWGPPSLSLSDPIVRPPTPSGQCLLRGGPGNLGTCRLMRTGRWCMTKNLEPASARALVRTLPGSSTPHRPGPQGEAETQAGLSSSPAPARNRTRRDKTKKKKRRVCFVSMFVATTPPAQSAGPPKARRWARHCWLTQDKEKENLGRCRPTEVDFATSMPGPASTTRERRVRVESIRPRLMNHCTPTSYCASSGAYSLQPCCLWDFRTLSCAPHSDIASNCFGT